MNQKTAGCSSPLRVLFVEDSPADLRLVKAALQSAGYELECEVVDTLRELEEVLSRRPPQIVLSDYELRGWTALETLKAVKASCQDIPVIVVSGSLGDEAAAGVIKSGATDYVLKDRLARLPSAIERALEEKSLRDEKRQAEAQIHLQLRRLQSLRTIDIAITSTVELRVALSVVLDQVTTQLGVDAASVLLFDQQTQTFSPSATRGFRSASCTFRDVSLLDDPARYAVISRKRVIISEGLSGRSFTHAMAGSKGLQWYLCTPLIAKGQVEGVLELWRREAFEPNPEWLEFLDALANQAAIAIDNALLYEQLQKANAELLSSYDSTLRGWVHALDMRDKETEGHTQRVTDLTMHFAQVCTFSSDELIHIRRGALLHDIGKMGIPDAILNKPGALTAEEWQIMRLHPEYAHHWISPIPFLRPALDIPYSHHEKWDGSGYPRGLKGDAIPLAARLFAFADVWDALRSDRPYRAGLSTDAVRKYIADRSGTHFDPSLVHIFLEKIVK